MIHALKQRWDQLRRGQPGTRFERYFHWRQQRRRSHLLRTVLLITGGALIFLGVLLMPAPGPGMLIVLIGAGLLAEESVKAARWFDRFEICARTLLQNLRQR
jgi:hypothetical protein